MTPKYRIPSFRKTLTNRTNKTNRSVLVSLTWSLGYKIHTKRFVDSKERDPIA